MIKFVFFAWVVVVACLVGQVFLDQPPTEEEGSCTSPDNADLQNVAKQTTLMKGLSDVTQMLKDVRDAVMKPCTEASPLLYSERIFLLKRRSKMCTTFTRCLYL